MSVGRQAEPDTTPAASEDERSSPPPAAAPAANDELAHTPLAQRRAGPQSREEAEEHYVAARDAWTAAMRAANSGRAADLASLAIAQEAYEHATAEVERWRSGARVAIPIEAEPPRANIEAAVGQQLAWQRVRDHEERPSGLVSRVLRRITRRG